MRFDGIYLSGLGVRLGEPVRTPWLVRRGLLAVADARRTRQRSVCVASASGPELAAAAALDAVRSYRRASGRWPSIRVHLHAGAGDEPDVWSAAWFVLDQLAVSGCEVVCEIDAMSNGMMLGVELAASLLVDRPDVQTALITGGDRFRGDQRARYGAEHGVLYGDAGAAMVMSRSPGMLRLVSVATRIDPARDGLTRDGPARATDAMPGASIDLPGRRRSWRLEHDGPPSTLLHHDHAVAATMRMALADAGITLDQVRWIVVPFLGYEVVQARWCAPLGIDEARTLMALGLHLGHLGAADHVVGLRHLIATAAVDPGDYVMLASAGAGMTWTTAILQVMQAPPPFWDNRNQETNGGSYQPGSARAPRVVA